MQEIGEGLLVLAILADHLLQEDGVLLVEYILVLGPFLPVSFCCHCVSAFKIVH